MLMKRMTLLCSVAVFIPFMGFNGLTFAGDLEPSAPPGSTMKTLDEIPPTWSQILPASERFELALDGAAVLDKETRLVWDGSPDTTTRTWTSAINHCYIREVGDRKGWHLPTVEQLASLVDSTQSNPSLPSGHPFSNVQSSWSATTVADDTTDAWLVFFYNGNVNNVNKVGGHYVWCVRGGQGSDAY